VQYSESRCFQLNRGQFLPTLAPVSCPVLDDDEKNGYKYQKVPTQSKKPSELGVTRFTQQWDNSVTEEKDENTTGKTKRVSQDILDQ
jgi:hypothetical protein